ncbi:GNAT family N-acetyltransferase [Lysinibacillus sp. ZYM-1]|nr:GNAT family N-acetyltransferase [Lysinibacillus sp. ZYM-1]
MDQNFICDVMVHPDFQRKGIGTMVMETLLEHCPAGKYKMGSIILR